MVEHKERRMWPINGVQKQKLKAGLARRELVVSICISLLLVMLFVALGLSVRLLDQVLVFDEFVYRIMRQHASPHLDRALHLADLPADVTMVLIPVISLVLVIRRKFHSALVVAASAASLYGVHLVCKGVFERARPGTIVAPGNFSDYLYPSGHTVGTFLTYGLLAYLVAHEVPSRVVRLVVLCAGTVIALASFSLVYFGYHYTTDVVGGCLLAGAWLVLSITLLRLDDCYVPLSERDAIAQVTRCATIRR
jgi:undecaprenyl-diphosphatase